MEPISIVIPTYTAADYLRVCLDAIRLTQHNPANEIVVVIDGTASLIEPVLDQFTDLNIKRIVFPTNQGLAVATNYGFYNSSNRLCLNINDDNVVCYDFDKILVESFEKNRILVPNQVEPRPSIFRPFIIKNYGESAETFRMSDWLREEETIRRRAYSLGWTLPFFMERERFIACGGFDVMYDSPHVIDWDFFHKNEILGMNNVRLHFCNFYHFGSRTARTEESYVKEQAAHEYFKYKWSINSYNKLLQ